MSREDGKRHLRWKGGAFSVFSASPFPQALEQTQQSCRRRRHRLRRAVAHQAADPAGGERGDLFSSDALFSSGEPFDHLVMEVTSWRRGIFPPARSYWFGEKATHPWGFPGQRRGKRGEREKERGRERERERAATPDLGWAIKGKRRRRGTGAGAGEDLASREWRRSSGMGGGRTLSLRRQRRRPSPPARSRRQNWDPGGGRRGRGSAA